eukprot:COSAG01_NODE_6779_length_3502_cov_3.425213_4_plen_204_part_00
MALEGAVPSRGRRWHRSRLRDGGGNGNGVALTLCGGAGAVVGAGGRRALAGTALAPEQAARRWQQRQRRRADSVQGLWLALEGAVPSQGRRWHRSRLHDGGGNSNGAALTLCGGRWGCGWRWRALCPRGDGAGTRAGCATAAATATASRGLNAGALGLWLALEGAMPGRWGCGWRWRAPCPRGDGAGTRAGCTTAVATATASR